MSESSNLAAYTTLGVGGPARSLVVAECESALCGAVQAAAASGARWLVLGGGSNVLIPDAGFPGTVIINRVTGWMYERDTSDSVRAVVAAGTVLDAFIADTVQRGYWGLENLSHIPGSVGATPIQNVGAYGVEVADCIESVVVYDAEHDTKRTLTARECAFGYRDSFFKQPAGRNLVVLTVTFSLSRTPRPQLSYRDLVERFPDVTAEVSQAAIREAVISIRATKFPDWHTIGTAGSFFKNPIVSAEQQQELKTRWPELPTYEQPDGTSKLSLGWLLDKVCGLRGHCEGGVCLSSAQALVLTNTGTSATAIEAFATRVADIVYERTAVQIEREVTTIS